MADYTWVLIDRSGEEMRTTDSFASKEDAESWMGSQWSELREEGAGAVSLRVDGAEVYLMSLDEA